MSRISNCCGMKVEHCGKDCDHYTCTGCQLYCEIADTTPEVSEPVERETFEIPPTEPSDSLDEIFDTLTFSSMRYGPARDKAKQSIDHQIKLAEFRARVDELGHVVLDYGNRRAETSVDGKFITVKDRHEQLRAELEVLEKETK